MLSIFSMTRDDVTFSPHMNNVQENNWHRFARYYREFPSLKLAMDISRVRFSDDYFEKMRPAMEHAFAEMDDLERGGIANKDEQRQVGHYWLRNPDLAPTKSNTGEHIRRAIAQIGDFVQRVHTGQLVGAHGTFLNILLIGIGGSALGPQLVSRALGHPKTDRMKLFVMDNTDPDGMDQVLANLDGQLGRTLCIVISKAGATAETRNGMKEVQAAYKRAGLAFEKHAVAVTVSGSALDLLARGRAPKGPRWLGVFPTWNWVGGRTSETSAVGLLPAALQGIDTQELLAGARACDDVTREHTVADNPAAQLALMWYCIGGGRGGKDMVIIPYKDRLEMFARYQQQLVMESLGKELDRIGKIVNQGITVYGNKGSTDQHAYIQQLRDGLHNFFVVFIEVLKDREAPPPYVEVAPGVTSGDYLSGFLLGTRQALHEKGRDSITLTIEEVSPFCVGVLIALFERAVGFYASLIDVNAYHQPGVQAGKDAADRVLKLQRRICGLIAADGAKWPANGLSAVRIAEMLHCPDQSELVFKICRHLAANPGRGLRLLAGFTPVAARFAPE